MEREAGLRLVARWYSGPHLLRHTYCSHLAMRGAPARAGQEVARHYLLPFANVREIWPA